MYEYETFESLRLMDYVEAWFDNHPEPENIEMFEFDNEVKTTFYLADQVYNCFMIKIECENARRATWLSRHYKYLSEKMGVTQILINKQLFLFTDLRF